MTDRADRFTVVLDANVIAGALTRNILLSLAEAGLYRPRWSAQILDEFERYFIKRYDDAEGAIRQRANMENAFPEALVTDYEQLIDALTLPDPHDRHVLAAAIQTRAALIVTDNLRDFPSDDLAKFEIEAIGLDHFLADALDLAGIEAIAALRKMRERFNVPEIDADVLLSKIEQLKLLETAAILYRYRELL
ncbi:PIN domain-containing protein [Pelagibius sp. Alg239-R121]|uniref:PIN domain-containing protein n=1 Tax=Pelagibius sp. Alg239-R121 TaxID=2993448 RepID=UPI0024A6CFBA|nr:PIN domain-containing protein [Pelagibius sp. Alg239-R121]